MRELCHFCDQFQLQSCRGYTDWVSDWCDASSVLLRLVTDFLRQQWGILLWSGTKFKVYTFQFCYQTRIMHCGSPWLMVPTIKVSLCVILAPHSFEFRGEYMFSTELIFYHLVYIFYIIFYSILSFILFLLSSLFKNA